MRALLLTALIPLSACIAGSPGETAGRAAIERLTIEYAYLLDHGRAGELAALFTI
jgi:hypothetical protein